MSSVHPDSLASLPTGISTRMPSILDDLTGMVIAQIPAFQGDEEISVRLRASIESNVSLLAHVMQHAGDVYAVDAPTGAVDFANWIAQRGIPFSALLRAYTLCTARFYELCLQEIAKSGPPTDTVLDDAARLSRVLHSYIDHVCERISKSYDTERERWLRQFDVTRADRVRALLDNQSIDLQQAETDLRYPLSGSHLGLIAWTTGARSGGNELLQLQHIVGTFAEAFDVSGTPLILPRDNNTVWAWLPMKRTTHPEISAALGYASDKLDPNIKVAIGEITQSVQGFARTHQQAETAQVVALFGGIHGQAVTPYSSVSSIGFLCRDLSTAKTWIAESLGDLVTDTEHFRRLRDSLEIFLECGGSFTAAADRLHCHKNTVQYRIRKAEAARGTSFRNRTLDLQLALHACRWLGSTVLRNPNEPLPQPTPPAPFELLR